MARSYLNISGLPRGIRNNNPGNLIITSIKWNGKVPIAENKDGKFEQFYELRYGIRALMRDIYSDYNRGLNNVTDLISEFAPNFENDTQAYINSVISDIGTNFISEMTESQMIAICKAIIKVENGSNYASFVTDQDYKDAIAILGLPLKKKVVG